MQLRGRELVERIARELTGRLGAAELLWSRVSREPAATIAVRPGSERTVPAHARSRANGTREEPGPEHRWPATMEGAVRSGRAAARARPEARTEVAA
jgi:hypothetical protein